MTYVAIGDSFAAGVGAGTPEDDCGRTTAAYPLAVSRALQLPLTFEACSGATAVEAAELQSDAVTSDTTLITVTVGGNDLDFVGVLTEAAKPAWLTDSGPVLEETERRVESELPNVLKPLYATLRDRAPFARIVVIGYPALFSGGDCSLVTFFSTEEISRLNATADRLAEVIGSVAEGADAEFVDMRDEFSGRGTCGDPEWINGPAWPLDGSYHPNEAGQDAYARETLDALGHTGAITTTAPQPTIIRAPKVDRPVPVFTPPDLTSPESLAAAAAWGLNPDHVAELGRRVRPQEPGVPPDPEAAHELAALHEAIRVERGWA